MPLDRRELLKGLLLTAAAGTVSGQSALADASDENSRPASGLIDTNVSLFSWPFRRLPYDTPDELIARLQSLGIVQAWAGSFEGVLHRDIRAVNSRLAEICSRSHGFLLPFGTVNLSLPDWKEDLRCCHEVHRMPGIRLLPNYHGYTLPDENFAELLNECRERKLLVQLAVSLEDTRTQHEHFQVPDVDLSPLPELLVRIPEVDVLLLNHKLRGAALQRLTKSDNVFFDTARVDGSSGIAELLKTAPAAQVVFGSHFPFLIAEAETIKLAETELWTQDCRSRLTANAKGLSRRHSQPAPIVKKPEVPARQERRGTLAGPSVEFPVWDSYFLPSGTPLVEAIENAIPALDWGNFQRACLFLHVGIGTADRATEARIKAQPETILQPLQRWPRRLLGFLYLNPSDVAVSLAALDRWIANGPLLGVYFPGAGPGALPCSHPNYEPLVQRIQELGGLIMQHTWWMTGGKAVLSISSPLELAELAAKYPQQTFIAAHAGGEWEKGIRAVRSLPNIFIETSGFDPTAGFVDMAVRELGAERIIFGSHLPSRSLGTELGKVFGAQLTDGERHLILSENLKRLLLPQMQAKHLL